MTFTEAIECFTSELGYPHSVATDLLKAVEEDKIIVHSEFGADGLVGTIGFNRQGVGEFLWVREDRRGSSIAHRLYQKAHQLAKEQGLYKTQIYASPERVKFYTKRGYKITHVIMERQLC